MRGPVTRIVVTDGEQPAALAVVRGLRAAGYEPWVTVTSENAPAARSRAVAGVLSLPATETNLEAFAAGLVRAAGRVEPRAILPGSEQALVALAEHVDDFPDGLALGVCSPEQVARVTDKRVLEELAEGSGLPVPPSQLLEAGSPLDDAPLPAVVKPIRSLLPKDGALLWFGPRRVEDSEALRRALARLPGGVGIVQRYLEGRIVTVNGVAWRGEVVGSVHKEGVRIWPPQTGHVSYARTVPRDPELERATRALIAETGWSGIFNLQLIEHGGRRYVIDLNPRPYHSLALAVAAGANLPAAWVKLLLGEPPGLERYRVGVRFRDERDDAYALVSELAAGRPAVALRGVLPRRGTAHAAYAPGDPGPLAAVVGSTAAAGARRARRMIGSRCSARSSTG